MKTISPQLFNELKSTSASIDVGWLVVRTDAVRLAFTSSDIPFTYNDDVYLPSNGFNPSAIVSKSNMSVDNMECQVLESDLITDTDLRAGLWNNAVVTVFWINRYHPEWGVVPLRGGQFGEVVVKEGEFTVQLRSLFQQLQQPFGYFYTLQCGAQLGDARCKVNLDPPVWQPNQLYTLGILTDAGIGSVVQPHDANGFWYVANYTSYEFVSGTPPVAGVDTGGGIPSDVGDTVDFGDGTPVSTVSSGEPELGGGIPTLTDGVVTDSSGYDGTTTDASVLRQPTQPGQGLSGNDDLGPNDATQVDVGPAFDSLSQFDYQGDPVDIFGIKL